MSQNIFLNEKKLALHFAQILNISIDDDITIMDIESELNTIDNLVSFRNFVKEKLNYERFRFLTGYQKFLALVKEFRKDEYKLDEVAQEKVNTFAYKLYKKTVDIFEEVNLLIQNGHDIRSRTVSFYISEILKNQPKEIQVLELVGKREYLLRLCNSSKLKLEIEIKKAVEKLALEKQYPQLVNKKSFEGLETIKKLQSGLR